MVTEITPSDKYYHIPCLSSVSFDKFKCASIYIWLLLMLVLLSCITDKYIAGWTHSSNRTGVAVLICYSVIKHVSVW